MKRLAFPLALALVLAAVSACGAAPPKKGYRPKGQMLTTTQGKERLMGYLSLPKGAGTHAGIIVIQEWWGLNDWVKQQADSLAAHGYVAFAPDLYRGKVAYDEATAHQL